MRRFKLIVLDVVDSTQDEARRLRDAEEFTVVVAREQVRGRGRFRREWVSPRGGLWFTVVLYPMKPARFLSALGLLASLAVAESIEEATGLRALVRWPNDVYVNGRKVAGIILEQDVVGDVVQRTFLGIGVNANFKAEALPPYLEKNATTLREELGKEIDSGRLLTRILLRLRAYYYRYVEGDVRELMDRVRGRLDLVEKRVWVEKREGREEGVFLDVDEMGGILLKTGDGVKRLDPSEVVRLTVD